MPGCVGQFRIAARSAGLLAIGAVALAVCLPVLGRDEPRLTPAQKEEQQFRAYSARIEQRLFGESDATKVEKLSQKAEHPLRLYYVALLAGYQRQMCREPLTALQALAPALLGPEPGKAWIRACIAADKQALAAWTARKVEAERSKSVVPPKPSGLTLEFPTAWREQLAAQPDRGRNECALEVARCLMVLGKVQDALGIIDALGQSFTDESRVLAAECGGDLLGQMQLHEKAIGMYEFGLKVLASLVSPGGATELQQLLQRRLTEKLVQARRRWDIERYGEGYVLYR